MTNCKLVVNGKTYGGFKEISIKQSVEAISSLYSFDFSDMWDAAQDPWPLNPQDLVQIELHGQSVIRGYIDVLKGSLSGSSVTYTVEGRDKTSDLVDCSCVPKPYTSIGLLAICESVASQFPVSFTLAPGIDGNQKVTTINADAGESVFEVLDKISSATGVLFVPDGKGDLVITKRGQTKAEAKLIEGVNAKDFSFTKDYSERYSDYTVQGSAGKSQSVAKGSAWFAPAAGAQKATKSVPRSDIQDLGVNRFRPLYVKQPSGATAITVQNRASWEANVRAAKSLEISCTVQGWLQAPGRLWRINEMIQVTAPRLGIGNAYGDEYLIAEIEYKLTESGGEETWLKLYPKDAFLPDVKVDKLDKKKKDEIGKGWFSDNSNDIQVYPGVQSPSKRKV